MSKYKKDIIRLRKQGKTYSEIEDELECSIGTISHHCKNEGLTDIGKKQKEISGEKKKKIREHYKNHTRKQTAKQFDVSKSTVQKYGETNKKDTKTGGRKARKKDTCKTGDISEMKAKMKLLEKGYTVSEPINSGSRYDLVADDGEELYKVQVKTAYSENENTSTFECRSHPQSGKKKVSYKKDEVDVFIVYSPKFDETYWINFGETNETVMTLRHVKTKNGQTKNINYAEHYVI